MSHAHAFLVIVAFVGLRTLADAADDFVLSSNLHRLIMAQSARDSAEPKAYINVIPGTNVSYRMMPISAGEFLRGSPDGEAGRKPDEGPQHRVRIDAFWMGACEVSWDEFELFLDVRRTIASRTTAEKARNPYTNTLADAVALPSAPYIELSLGMGRKGYPAINMTQHAANKYCQWLSALTGHFYRLPTEAEWEYACRARSTHRYSFGDDKKRLDDFAWFESNSSFKYQKVGRKKANAWGLYDMHGNVAEWTLDGYDAQTYQSLPDGVTGPYVRGKRPYPHVVRGGSWKDGPPQLRSASRQFSVKKWKEADSSIPKSVWHMVEADHVGFRIVRPVRVPSAEEMHRAWNNGVELE